MTEATVHGHQIASAVHNASWDPQVGEVMLLWHYGIGLIQALLLPEASGLSETWELRFRGDGAVFFTIDDGQVSGDPGVRGSEVRACRRGSRGVHPRQRPLGRGAGPR